MVSQETFILPVTWNRSWGWMLFWELQRQLSHKGISPLLSLRFQLLSSSRPEAELKTQLYLWAPFRLLFDIEHQIQKDFHIFCWEETHCTKKVVLLLYSLKSLKLVRPQLWCMHPRMGNEKQTEVFSRTNSKPWEIIVAFLLFSRNWREEESTEWNIIQ